MGGGEGDCEIVEAWGGEGGLRVVVVVGKDCDCGRGGREGVREGGDIGEDVAEGGFDEGVFRGASCFC